MPNLHHDACIMVHLLEAGSITGALHLFKNKSALSVSHLLVFQEEGHYGDHSGPVAVNLLQACHMYAGQIIDL